MRTWNLYLTRKSARLCASTRSTEDEMPVCLELFHPKMRTLDVDYILYLSSQADRFCVAREDALALHGDPELIGRLMGKLRPSLRNKILRASAPEKVSRSG